MANLKNDLLYQFKGALKDRLHVKTESLSKIVKNITERTKNNDSSCHGQGHKDSPHKDSIHSDSHNDHHVNITKP